MGVQEIMSTNGTLAEIQNIISENRDVPIVVEGKKDKNALAELGFSNIYTVSGKTVYMVVDQILSDNHRSVIILTDFDKAGTEKFKQLTDFFQRHHITTNSSVRIKIHSLFKIHQIEELKGYTKFINSTGDDYNGETSPVYNKIFNRSRIHRRWSGGEARRNRGNIRPD